jgi:predicted naringenin-chalcone synthase
MTQDEAVKMFTDIVCEDERQSRLAKALFRKAEVGSRATVVPHKVAYNWCATSESRAMVDSPLDLAQPSQHIPEVIPGQSRGPTTRERMELFSRFASDLAVESSQQALCQANWDAPSITHLITVTCTGFDAPGVDIELIERLGLPKSTQRIQVGFMGCHGAINGLRAARAIAESNPTARILLCAFELCSLHYRFNWDSEGIIGNALFADGSAAIAIGGASSTMASNTPEQWRVVDTGSVVIGDSRQSMSWSIGDHGFNMRLSSDVGERIEGELAQWLNDWLATHDLTLHDIDYWGVHPGGPRIVNAVQTSLQLNDEAISTSRKILKQHGNMSSPTVIFVLEEFQKIRSTTTTSKDLGHCLLLGFGPGLVAEVALLRIGEQV